MDLKRRDEREGFKSRFGSVAVFATEQLKSLTRLSGVIKPQEENNGCQASKDRSSGAQHTILTAKQNISCRFSSHHCDPPPPQAPPVGIATTILRHHHQCLDSMGGFCMRRYQHLYPCKLAYEVLEKTERKKSLSSPDSAGIKKVRQVVTVTICMFSFLRVTTDLVPYAQRVVRVMGAAALGTPNTMPVHGDRLRRTTKSGHTAVEDCRQLRRASLSRVISSWWQATGDDWWVTEVSSQQAEWEMPIAVSLKTLLAEDSNVSGSFRFPVPPEQDVLHSDLVFGSWSLGPGLRVLVFGSWSSGPGLWVLVFGSWSSGPGLWVLVFGSWSSGPGLWVLVFGSWSLGPGLRVLVGLPLDSFVDVLKHFQHLRDPRGAAEAKLGTAATVLY
ncbi:hypothetical protein EYF80_031249 [Liparis tanakae]|uniref:Uncharacterized protein n=1 Tax=Liparis tanakae TaxID=230148 RepID=A0A4Z2GXZ4_9TELE|nr:hypothetical protein EYF80_031249 [Liparis tanakae]